MSRLTQKTSGLNLPKDGGNQPKPAATSGIKANKIAWIITGVLTIVTGFLVYQLVDMKLHPNKESAAQAKKIVEEVGRLVVLPEGEDPTVATVVNPEQLADQPFFAQAKKGYKVLIYTLSQRAILYDPDRHKVVEIAPVNLNSLETSLQDQVQNSTEGAQ